MEKRWLVAVALSFAVLLLWQVIFPPPKPPPPEEPVTVEGEAPPTPSDETGVADLPDLQPPPSEPVEPAIVAAGSREVEVETDLHRVVLTNRGGRVLSWRLIQIDGGEGEALEVVPRWIGSEVALPLGVELDRPELVEQINDALFEVERRQIGGESGGERIRFRWADGRGLRVEKVLEFRQGDYLVGVELNVTDRGRRLPARLSWGPGFQTREKAGKGFASYYYSHQAVWNISGQVSREKEVEEPLRGAGRLLWGGLEDQYFAALIVPRAEQAEFTVRAVEVQPTPIEGETAGAQQRPLMSVAVPRDGALLFVGPKNYRLLSSLGFQLQKAVWFSSIGLFDLMSRMLYHALIWMHDNLVSNYGVAIILTTVLLRILLFPLNQFSMVRMKRMQTDMQKLQPKINAIKNRYRKKKDAESRVKMNNELMELYRKEGVNPMGGMTGCLPLLAQFPILIGFYYMLLAAVELRGAPFFGWIQDLTLKDPWYVTPILMGVTMFLQQKMSTAKLGDPAQQRIMMMMPVIFTVMFLNLPSGLVLYWFVNNLLGIGQQWLVNRTTASLQDAKQRA